MRLAWRGHLVLIGTAVLIAGVAVLLAGTAAGHSQRTAIRQGGVVVAWVSGGGTIGGRYWLYCDNEETVAYDGGMDGRLYVERTRDALGWAVRVRNNGWKVLANPDHTGRTVLVGSVIRRSSSRWNIVRTAQPLNAQWVRIKPRLVAQAVGRDGVAAGASFLLQSGTCR